MCRKSKKVKQEECLNILSNEFSNFDDHRAFYEIPLKDFLMSSFAIFSLKYPSLLSFEKAMSKDMRRENMKSLFGVSKIPSDTHLRDVMDVIETDKFRPVFKKIFSFVQRNKLLENYEFLRIKNQPHYLIAVDGTGYFRSDKVGCVSCNNYDSGEKKRLNRYGHNMLGASLVHPDRAEVISLCPEPIISQDGNTKNDCELNAFKRFIPNFRKDHPKLNTIISLDALYATEPPIKLMFENDCSFIIAIKETDQTVFRQINDGEKTDATKHHEYTYEIGDKVKKQVIHRYRYRSNVHLNQDPRSTRINFVEFWEEISWEGKRGPEVKRVHFSWITDLKVNKDTIVKIMKGGRSRWKVENETFNTLKNQGYSLEHNYGHGKNNLSVNFIMMMFLAFLIDQIQQASCQSFKKALEMQGSKQMLWNAMTSQFRYFFFEEWDHFFQCLNKEGTLQATFIPNSS